MLKYLTLYNISNSFFYTQKRSYFICESSHSQTEQVIFYLLNLWPTYVLSTTILDQNMTNLRCTADHLLNIRPVESGIIPDHFSPVGKLIPLTTTSQSGPVQPPLYFRQTYALSNQSPLIADPSIFQERERVGVDGLSGVNGA